jgi:hypothetical protein
MSGEPVDIDIGFILVRSIMRKGDGMDFGCAAIKAQLIPQDISLKYESGASCDCTNAYTDTRQAGRSFNMTP